MRQPGATAKSGGQPYRDASRPEGLGEFLEATRDARAAEIAGTARRHVIAADVVPITHHEGLLAARTIGRAAGFVMHVAGVDVVQARVERNFSRARQRRRRRAL